MFYGGKSHKKKVIFGFLNFAEELRRKQCGKSQLLLLPLYAFLGYESGAQLGISIAAFFYGTAKLIFSAKQQQVACFLLPANLFGALIAPETLHPNDHCSATLIKGKSVSIGSE